MNKNLLYEIIIIKNVPLVNHACSIQKVKMKRKKKQKCEKLMPRAERKLYYFYGNELAHG
jgi:hypothetical protein